MKFLIALAALACCASAYVVQDDRLLPSQPAELPLNDTSFEFDNELIKGVATLSDAIAYGLDTLSDTLVFNLLGLTLRGDVTLNAAQIVALYTADGVITLSNGTIINLVGAGNLDAAGTVLKATGLDVTFTVNLITSRVQVSKLDLVPSIESCTIATTGDSANGQPIDWVATCRDIPAIVAEYWVVHKDTLIPDLIKAANVLLAELTLQDLIDIIGGGGIKMVYA